jgi:hypothetical protein
MAKGLLNLYWKFNVNARALFIVRVIAPTGCFTEISDPIRNVCAKEHVELKNSSAAIEFFIEKKFKGECNWEPP